jgi:glycosyltransferase involved in cell wall biosynthesis
MPGYVDYSNLALYYGSAQVFVHMPQQESWGISVGEAMACGLPVISAPWVGAAHELVEEDVTGWMSGPGEKELSDRISRSSQSRLKGAVMQERAKKLVDVEASARSLLSLVERLRRNDH